VIRNRIENTDYTVTRRVPRLGSIAGLLAASILSVGLCQRLSAAADQGLRPISGRTRPMQ
jgi:hypothetical protein